MPQKRRKTLEEKQEELKRKVLQDGKDWESWHLDQNVTPSHLPVSAILNPKEMSLFEQKRHGGYSPSKFAICEGTNHQFMMDLHAYWNDPKCVIRCEKCGRDVRVRICDEATFTREYSRTFPNERVKAYVCFHRVDIKPRVRQKGTL